MGGGEQAKYLARIEVYELLRSGNSSEIVQMGAKAIPGLSKILEEGEFWEMQEAMGALSRIDDPKATRLLKSLLEHPEWQVRKAAIEILGAREPGWLEGKLRAIEKRDANHDVRWSARKLLNGRSAPPPKPKGKRPENFGNLKEVVLR